MIKLKPNTAHLVPLPSIRAPQIDQDHQTHGIVTRRSLLSGISLSLTLSSIHPALATDATSPAEAVFASTSSSVVACGILNRDSSFTTIASGVVWSNKTGHIVSAYTPVNAVLRQQQTLYIAIESPTDGNLNIYPVSAIEAREPSLDLIVLRSDNIQQELASPLPVVRSSELKIGQELILIGSTLDGQRTVSTGVLSAKNRAIPAPNGQAIRGALQTDVNITFLGLGGALVDSKGALVGIPTVSYSKPGSGRSSGVNFAISSDTLIDAVPTLAAYGNLAGRR